MGRKRKCHEAPPPAAPQVDRGRRELLRALAGLPLAGAALGTAALGGQPGAPSGPAPSGPPPSPASGPSGAVVARARRTGLLAANVGLDGAKLDDGLARVIARAGGEDAPVAGLRALFRPDDVVGIKVNALAGRGLSPDPRLVQRLTEWLVEAGVPARNIVVWDRSDRELHRAGFRLGTWPSGVRCGGTNESYDWTPREWGPSASCFARVMVEDVTALINVGVLKDHDLSGVSVGMKNWYGAIHNPNKHHDDGCAPFIPHLAACPLVRHRLRLTVIDASTAQYHGGPARSPQWTWPLESLFASTDPVAMDAVGWRIIEERRAEAGMKTLAAEEREPRWIADAAGLGLGTADPDRIEVVDL